jgi:hypothetical protein
MAQKQQSITESMFGLSLPITPEFGGQMPIEKFRGSTPMGNITESYRQAGQSLQGSVRRLFGQQTPQEATVQKTVEQEKDIREAILTFQASNPNIDMNTPQALKKLANHAVTINPDLRMFSIQLNQRADALQSTLAANKQKEFKAMFGKIKPEDYTPDSFKKAMDQKDISLLVPAPATVKKQNQLTNPELGLLAQLQMQNDPNNSTGEYSFENLDGSIKTMAELSPKVQAELSKLGQANKIRVSKAGVPPIEKAAKAEQTKFNTGTIVFTNLDDAELGIQRQINNNETLNLNNVAGLSGFILSKIPGTEAASFVEMTKNIRANIGFDYLQNMRQNNPTGGALGQISNFELETLQAVLGSLSQKQTPQRLLKNIKILKKHYHRILNEAYNARKFDKNGKITTEYYASPAERSKMKAILNTFDPQNLITPQQRLINKFKEMGYSQEKIDSKIDKLLKARTGTHYKMVKEEKRKYINGIGKYENKAEVLDYDEIFNKAAMIEFLDEIKEFENKE